MVRTSRSSASASDAAGLRLLGGLTPETFLARHWQRRPLLIRQAVTDLDDLPDLARLTSLASRDDVESRLVEVVDGQWSMRSGPFTRLPRRRSGWTLLVQGVNLHDARADALMRRFDFVPAMRLDDLMISHATDGGGVGPHLDSYDVFLLQLSGKRRWRWRRTASRSQHDRALVDGVPLKLLAHFEPTDEAVLEPGDMLYLPPSCAHDGAAVGSCLTASIGFRAPSWNELTKQFLFDMAERDWPDGRPADAGRLPTNAPAAIDEALLAALAERLSRVRWTSHDVEAFVGRHFSEPKPQVWFDVPEPLPVAAFARRARRSGLRLDPRTIALYRGPRAWLAGEAFDLPSVARPELRRLLDRRVLDGAAVAAMRNGPALELLHAWWCDGWIHFDDGGSDATP